MTCAHTDQLDAYLDGDLAPQAARRFETHTESCRVCTDELALARRLQGALRAIPQENCPYDVYQGALDRIARESKDRPAVASAAGSAEATRRLRRPRWQALGLGVAFVILVALALLLFLPTAQTVPGPHVAETPSVIGPPDGPAPTDLPPAPIAEDTVDASVPAPEPSPRDVAPPPAPQAAPRRDVAAATPPPSPSPETSPDDAEVEAAREGVRLAFALFADANRQATESVRTNVGHGLDYVTDALTFLR